MIITISSLSCPQSSLKIAEAGIWWAQRENCQAHRTESSGGQNDNYHQLTLLSPIISQNCGGWNLVGLERKLLGQPHFLPFPSQLNNSLSHFLSIGFPLDKTDQCSIGFLYQASYIMYQGILQAHPSAFNRDIQALNASYSNYQIINK